MSKFSGLVPTEYEGADRPVCTSEQSASQMFERLNILAVPAKYKGADCPVCIDGQSTGQTFGRSNILDWLQWNLIRMFGHPNEQTVQGL